MINELRTLLLNEEASTRPSPGVNGEDIIPTTYRKVTTGFEPLRSAIFSNSREALFTNYRLDQFLRLINSVERVAPFLSSFDTRVTSVGRDFTLGRSISQEDTALTAKLDVTGQPPDTLGYLDWGWYLIYTGSDEITIRMTSGPSTVLDTYTLNFTDGHSDVIVFPGQTNLRFVLRYNGVLPDPATPPWQFWVSERLYPDTDLSGVLSNIDAEPGLYRGLFHLPDERDLSYLWASPNLSYRWASLLTGLALRTKEIVDGR